MVVTVDKGDANWKGREGFVPAVLRATAPKADNAVAITCGPPIMIKLTCRCSKNWALPPRASSPPWNEDEVRPGPVRPLQHRPLLRVQDGPVFSVRSCNSSLRNSSKSDPDSTAESASQPCGRNQRDHFGHGHDHVYVTTFRRHRVFVENLRGCEDFGTREHDCAFSDSVASPLTSAFSARVAD